MMAAYYNEFDLYAAQWLRNLIHAGHIAPGDLDTRSIIDVRPDDLKGYTQCHFFAGIGGWSLAARLAGWPDDRELWTGSCPCQPFSAAGKQGGFDDERHLWPVFGNLVAQRRPTVVFGEQVASKGADPWIDLVQTDLEALGYAVGAVPFPSAGIGAPHIRDRLYWLVDADDSIRRSDTATGHDSDRAHAGRPQGASNAKGRGEGGVANAHHQRRAGERVLLWPEEARREPQHDPETAGSSEACRPGPVNGQWRHADWIGCTDGKWRPVEPGTFPLAHGLSSRMGRLRAYGNAINPAQGAEVIRALMEVRP
jgi:DNA (cytosine-5)-methyltransferase 1